MRVLFVTRNFPPQIGGLEKVAYFLYSYLKKEIDVILIKWSGSKKLLFLVLPYFFIKASFILIRNKIDLIYLNEGFISILGVFLKVFGKPVVITIHGLDITYKNRIYQLVIPKCIARMDGIICISRATKLECIERNISKRKIYVIPNGIKDEFFLKEDKEKLKEEFIRKFDINIKNKKVLLSTGRLIKRKGAHWFIKEVIPLLLESYKDFLYLIVGDGPMRSEIQEIIREKRLSNWVKLLGKVDDTLLKIIYNISDIFIMPNIPVEGDMEGFGVVILEACSCKVPVIASNIEGIKDALLDGKMGILVEPLNIEGFKDNILRLIKDENLRRKIGEQAQKKVLEHFNWERIAKRYLEVFKKTKINCLSAEFD